MSSTGRGERLGGPEDFYQTPAWAVRRLLETWKPAGGLWLEPGAGNGAIIKAANSVRSDVEWLAVEIREAEEEGLQHVARTVVMGDFLDRSLPLPDTSRVSVVLGNPPFSLAQAFIERSRELCPVAEIVMLLRLNYIGSEDRADFMRTNLPSLRILPNRASFLPVPGKVGKVDSIEYAWFGWRPDKADAGAFWLLESTPKEERRWK